MPKLIVANGDKEKAQPDAALIAAITAAVAAFMETSANGIIIRSLRRCRPGAPQWGIAGREHQMNHKF